MPFWDCSSKAYLFFLIILILTLTLGRQSVETTEKKKKRKQQKKSTTFKKLVFPNKPGVMKCMSRLKIPEAYILECTLTMYLF